jgi:hypothetical protein
MFRAQYLVAAQSCLLSVAAFGEDFPIVMSRDDKVGDRYAMVASGQAVQRTILNVDGKDQAPQLMVIEVTVSAKGEVMGITAHGREQKTKYTIDKATLVANGMQKEMLPPASVIIAERAANKLSITKDGAPLAEDLTKMFEVVLPVYDETAKRDDAVYGVKERKKLGDTWPIDANAALGDALAKINAPFGESAFSGQVALAERVERADGFFLRLNGDMKIAATSLQLPAGVVAKKGSMRTTFSYLLPVDAKKKRASQKTLLESHVEGDGTVQGKAVVMSIDMKKVLEIEFNYSGATTPGATTPGATTPGAFTP